MAKTILCLVHDDRQGRKGGEYGRTAHGVETWCGLKFYNDGLNIKNYIFDTCCYLFDDYRKQFGIYQKQPGIEDSLHLNNIDAGINGRWYKPFAIWHAMSGIQDGDFLIYNDCSPEIWDCPIEIVNFNKFSLDIIHNLTTQNNDILTSFVKWDCQNIPENGLGLHIHKYFTTNRCMDKMGLRQYENSYQHASGMMCIRKTPETVKFVEEWLHWNLDPECASLGTDSDEYWQAESEFKVGHRHDQSISGLLLNARNAKLVDILHNDMNPYNFLQFCRVGQEYKFIDSNSPVDRESLDMTKIFIRRGSKVYNEQDVELNVWAVEGERIIVGLFEESAWATTRDKLRLNK